MSTHERPLAIACGDPAGVGPRIAVEAGLAFVADTGRRLRLFGDASRLGTSDPRIEVVDVGAVPDDVVEDHADHPIAGAHALRALDLAIADVHAGRAAALVTGPVSKHAIVLSGTPFVGQTEHLARSFGLADDDVTMCFFGPRLRTALVTTHLAIRDAPSSITAPRVARTIRHLAEALLRLGAPHGARVEVAGLNPHAGEHGLFGTEEHDVIDPVIAELARAAPFVDGRLRIAPSRPSEAVFREAARGEVAGVVAMLHDQATIASKLLDWGAAVNTTWGLPIVRTSVDHGVAYAAAKSGVVESDGMRAAIDLAHQLTTSR